MFLLGPEREPGIHGCFPFLSPEGAFEGSAWEDEEDKSPFDRTFCPIKKPDGNPLETHRIANGYPFDSDLFSFLPPFPLFFLFVCALHSYLF